MSRRRKVHHRKSFESKTRMTVQEYHATNAFPTNAKCAGCGNKPQVRGIVMVPADEAEKRGLIPKGAASMPALFPAIAPISIQLNEGGTPKWYIRMSMAYSCRLCRKDFEKTLAKAPSWCVVEINEGPDYRGRVSVGV